MYGWSFYLQRVNRSRSSSERNESQTLKSVKLPFEIHSLGNTPHKKNVFFQESPKLPLPPYYWTITMITTIMEVKIRQRPPTPQPKRKSVFMGHVPLLWIAFVCVSFYVYFGSEKYITWIFPFFIAMSPFLVFGFSSTLVPSVIGLNHSLGT